MDHWRVDTEQGPLSQYTSVERFDTFLRQVAAVGFEAIETFDFHLGVMRELFGSLEECRAFMQTRGIERVLSLFHGVMYDERQSAPHVRATHDRMFGYAKYILESSQGLGVQNLIVMPAGLYYDVEPVTDDKIRACAELWSRIGKMTLDYGVRTCCHHEFFCGIRSEEELRKFSYECPTRATWSSIATRPSTRSLASIRSHCTSVFDRCGGFHLKDTPSTDRRLSPRPDAEIMAPTTPRWFYEMGTPEGLVDFPALYRAMKARGYRGLVAVEHDKADIGGGNYPESTAAAAWYIENVLSRIYA
jgi:sugar phosphate isomerase/epimerase